MRKSVNWDNYVMRKFSYRIRQNVALAAIVSVRADYISKMEKAKKAEKVGGENDSDKRS